MGVSPPPQFPALPPRAMVCAIQDSCIYLAVSDNRLILCQSQSWVLFKRTQIAEEMKMLPFQKKLLWNLAYSIYFDRQPGKIKNL